MERWPQEGEAAETAVSVVPRFVDFVPKTRAKLLQLKVLDPVVLQLFLGKSGVRDEGALETEFVREVFWSQSVEKGVEFEVKTAH